MASAALALLRTARRLLTRVETGFVERAARAALTVAATWSQVMSLVRLLGFTTLECGCVVGRYLELSGGREVVYVEEKGAECATHGHRRNHSIPRARMPRGFKVAVVAVARAS
jgi:hypothetical protein